MLTASGAGYSRWRDIAVTRWREDATCDDWGSFVFLRDTQSGAVWSAGAQPVGSGAEDDEVVFGEDRAEFIHRDGALTTTHGCSRLRRGRWRGSPRVLDQQRTPFARDRAHVLRRNRADDACRRHCASGFRQDVRRRRSISPNSARSSRHAAGVRTTSRKFGPLISRSSNARSSPIRNMNRIGRVSSAVAAPSAPRSPWRLGDRFRTRSGPCSTRSSRSGIV